MTIDAQESERRVRAIAEKRVEEDLKFEELLPTTRRAVIETLVGAGMEVDRMMERLARVLGNADDSGMVSAAAVLDAIIGD